MVIVDSSVWIDYFADRLTPEVAALDALFGSERVAVGDLALCEVLQGIRHERQFRCVRGKLLALSVLQMGGTDMALEAARNYRTLRQLGITVRGTIDCIIATYCIEHGHVLLHNDRDFDAFEEHLGLRVLHPQPSS